MLDGGATGEGIAGVAGTLGAVGTPGAPGTAGWPERSRRSARPRPPGRRAPRTFGRTPETPSRLSQPSPARSLSDFRCRSYGARHGAAAGRDAPPQPGSSFSARFLRVHTSTVYPRPSMDKKVRRFPQHEIAGVVSFDPSNAHRNSPHAPRFQCWCASVGAPEWTIKSAASRDHPITFNSEAGGSGESVHHNCCARCLRRRQSQVQLREVAV